jgi:beta-phosphoglucomutase-like phosphatase (HAD superfamily)
VESYLEGARRVGLKLGMASSSPWKWVSGHLNRLGLIDYFDEIRTCESVSHPKPAPEQYLAVLDGLKLTPSQAIALEDSPPGVTAAKRAGVFCAAVPTRLTRRLPLDHADLLLASLADITLEELIRRANEGRNGHN